jgi:hypothetical protein
MASYGYSLEQYLKNIHPTSIDNILTFALFDRQLYFSNLLKEPLPQNFCFEVEIILSIQKYLSKKRLPPVVFEQKPNIQYTIQRIMLTKYNDNYVIKIKVDKWLNDLIDHVCEYVDQIYDIDMVTLQCKYRNSECYRE